jgi:DNA polymerase I-like protein with 3'-5' exonuclease and polymerase domains
MTLMTLSDQAKEACRIIREYPGPIAYDTETSGLDWKIHNPVGYVITKDAIDNFYIPVRHGGGGNLYDPDCPALTTPTDPITPHYFEKFLAAAFAERSRLAKENPGQYLVIMHHAKFDMHFSANAGIIIGRNIEDTQINEPLLDDSQRSYSLANCAERRGVQAKLGDDLYKRISQITGIPLGSKPSTIMEHYWRTSGTDDMAVEYAKQDGMTTLLLREAQYPLLVENDGVKSMELVHRIESRLVYTLFRMERKGIKVNMGYVDQLKASIIEELAQAKKALPDGFNERSPKQTREVMESAGVTNWPVTDAGNPSFTEKFLKQSEPGKAIMALRQMSNLLSKFVDPLIESHVHKGRVHANLNQLKGDETGAIGGRLSCSSPNLQAVTKRNKKLGPKFRKSFVADEGMVMYENDYSQCEPCLFAHYSGEPALIRGYNADPPEDMHDVVAKMLGVDRDVTAKRMNMGILTGMQSRTFAEHMDWPIVKATESFNAWFALFPNIKGLQARAKQNMLSRGYIRTLLGRRCGIDDKRFAYKATSRLIQGGNADIIKAKLLEIDEWLEEHGDVGELLMTIHDSIIFQVPKGPVGEVVAKEIYKIATNLQNDGVFDLRVPIRMDSHYGEDWATATYGQEFMDNFNSGEP